MSETSLTGKAKELYVATLLVNRRLHVFLPFVDNGFDLVVAKPDGTGFIPVQVKYKTSRSGFSLDRDDAEKFFKADAVLAFGSGDDLKEENYYFIPAKSWMEAAKTQDTERQDNKLVVRFSLVDDKWKEQFRGSRGIDAAFKGLLARTPEEAS